MPPSIPAGDARRVLIVDDSRAIQAIIRQVLESSELGPLQILTADDGADALDKVDSFRPDLVLSDWHMPGVSGIEMLQALRQTGHTEVAVGFVTTETNDERLVEARSNGAAFVLNKPFNDLALREVVGRTLQQARKAAPAGRPAADAEARKGPAALESIAQMQQQLFAHLGTRGFDLRRNDLADAPARQLPQLIALYSSTGRNGVYALGVLDLHSCCLIGGLAAGSSVAEIQLAMAQSQPSGKMVEHASRFMRAAASVLRKRSVTDQPSMSAARLTAQPFDKLAALLLQNSGRTDLVLQVPGTGEGRLSFLLV
ncbi:response regulator [Paucibacter soli]|uniref:response regulator n=1 Tax=Paucibacter soli TaxID=3133433 RepID=UPI0030976237